MQNENNEFTRLIFVRHGQIDSNTANKMAVLDAEPLNAKGIGQVELAAQRLAREFEPNILLCSPIYRARQSAEIVSAATGLPAVELADLSEIDFGSLSGLTFPEISERFPQKYAELRAFVETPDQSQVERPQFPDGETYGQITARVQGLTQRVLAEWPGKTLVAVAHGGIIKCALMLYAGGSFSRSVPFAIDNASLSVVDFYRGKPMIRLVNDISHLGTKLKYVKTRLL